jgi:hypothetical protein
MTTEGNEPTGMTREGEETTTMENEKSQRETSSQEEECSEELYGLSMERMAAGRTAQAPPEIEVKEHYEQEVVKQSGIGWKLIIAAILIIGLAVACGWLALELRKERQKHEQDLHECANEKEKYEEKWSKEKKNYEEKWSNEKEKYEEKWSKEKKNYEEKWSMEKKNYEEKFKTASKVDESTQTEELLESKRKLEADFEIMKKEVEKEYLEKETNLKHQLEMGLRERQEIDNLLISTLNEVLISKGTRHDIVLNAASFAVSSGYAYGLQKINDAFPEDLSISDIQVLDLIPIAFSSNQVSLVKTLLELPTRRKEEAGIKRNSYGQYYGRIQPALSKASNTIINIGDPEIAKVFYSKYGPHIIKLEKYFSCADNDFGTATNRALDEKKFEIAKCVKQCEIKTIVIIKPPGYGRALMSATYQQLKRVVKENELDMAIFYLEVVSKREKNEFLKWLEYDFEWVRDFLPDYY